MFKVFFCLWVLGAVDVQQLISLLDEIRCNECVNFVHQPNM